MAATLSDRDREVLLQISLHRYLRTHHVTALVFTDHASLDSAERITRRVLARLDRLGLIEAIEQRVGGIHGGASARIWRLRPAGARIITDGTSRVHTPPTTERFVDHCLAVADAHVDVRVLAAEEGTDDTIVRLEPDCWRRYLGSAGERCWLRPDLDAIITSHDAEGVLEDRWVIEVDMGNESLTTLHKKCAQYEAYRATGTEQAATDGVFPLVLWIMHGNHAERRATQLRERIERSPKLTTKLFRVVTDEHVLDVLRSGGQS
ncbi:replication-relaxation family protein [Flexivirga caeni]|uniref:replication-relaxation family protein n=1 Tax=Flexivirga caeni TaxID=2294115 RepID=UPI001315707A|nr:replication-relaxation family protein [Flexivirga caeni]